MRVAITGAAGTIGSLLADELEGDHALVLLDRNPLPHGSSIAANLSRAPRLLPFHPWSGARRWHTAFRGVDVVVHLAADPKPNAPWPRVLRHNIQATWNVLEAAARHRVRRVVYASSYWAVRGVLEALEPDCYRPDGPKLTPEMAPRPRTAYGLSKAMGEMAGRMFVDEGKLPEFLALRIGFCPKREPWSTSDAALRHRWIGHADMRSLLRRCVEAGFEGAHVAYAASAQPEAPFDLSGLRQLLGWTPSQTAEPVLVEAAS